MTHDAQRRNAALALARPTLEGRLVRLAPLTQRHVTAKYVAWLNDPEVNRHLEIRFAEQTAESVRDFVSKAAANPAVHLFAMEALTTGCHIGNIKLECSRPEHGRGEISLLIGDREFWGRGIGTEAIDLVAGYGFEHLHLHKLTSGCYSVNPASGRAFEKAGFHREAVLVGHYFCAGEWVDRWVYARFTRESQEQG